MNPFEAVTVGASPSAYVAPSGGQVFIAGGTVTSVTLTRNGVTLTVADSGFIPVGIGDVVSITYTAAPTVTFLPE
ncbi:MAG TPA: hypothetical protein VFN53_06365 [Acidobacteriaceae bacterium]|nr:hypothetical protein [Acidobacteriaceae bacterium]